MATILRRLLTSCNAITAMSCQRTISSKPNNHHHQFEFTVNKFNDIHIKMNNVLAFNAATNSSVSEFSATLKESLSKWRDEKRTAVWIYLPIGLANLAVTCGEHGFKFHHAEDEQAVLLKWLPEDRPSKVPLFATHQMGVAGAAYRADTNQLLVVKDRHMVRKDVWKLPGGAADLGEDIQATAVREVFEETGIRGEFRSVIAFRQQHRYPSAHGRSDLYVVCRIEPLNYEISACKDEIVQCEWIDIDKLCNYAENNVTQTVARLIRHGTLNGFHSVDSVATRLNSVFGAGHFYNLFHADVKL